MGTGILIGLAFIFLLLIRIQWVYHYRMDLLFKGDEQYQKYMSLPTFNKMVVQFWKWKY